MSDTTPEEAHYEVRDRNKFIALVEKLPKSTRLGISHRNHDRYSVFRVFGFTPMNSVHLHFEDRPGEPRSVYVTKIIGDNKTSKWLAGGLPAWLNALDIDRDDLLEALL